MAQVLSVSYWADFGHQNKVSLVTANSPSTVTSPLILGGTKQYCEGRTRSSSSSTNWDVSHIGAQTVQVWLPLRISRYPMTRCLSRYARTYLASDTGRHRFWVVDNTQGHTACFHPALDVIDPKRNKTKAKRA